MHGSVFWDFARMILPVINFIFPQLTFHSTLVAQMGCDLMYGHSILIKSKNLLLFGFKLKRKCKVLFDPFDCNPCVIYDFELMGDVGQNNSSQLAQKVSLHAALPLLNFFENRQQSMFIERLIIIINLYIVLYICLKHKGRC